MEDAHYFGQGRLIMTHYKNFDDTKPVTPVKTDKKDSVLYRLLSCPLYNRSVLRYKL